MSKETLCTGCGATVTVGRDLVLRDVAGSKYCPKSRLGHMLSKPELPPVAIKPEAAPEGKHTPGPYSITGGSYLGIIATVNGKSTQIGRAEGCGDRLSDEEIVANALLFKAAPDMLAALKIAESTLASFYRINFAQGLSKMSDGPDNWVLKPIRAAIAIAEAVQA